MYKMSLGLVLNKKAKQKREFVKCVFSSQVIKAFYYNTNYTQVRTSAHDNRAL